MSEPLVFELGHPGRLAGAQVPQAEAAVDLPPEMLRESRPQLPEVSELDAVRHYTRLSQQNFSIDTQFYPLGSCTMKYNPRGCNTYAMLPGFLDRHPLAPEDVSQGFLACMYELQQMLCRVTGMQAFSLTPMAGAQGELSGVAMIRAYHLDRGDTERTEILVPDAPTAPIRPPRSSAATRSGNCRRPPTATWTSRRCENWPVPARRASCSPIRPPSGCSSGGSGRCRRSSTRPAGCSTTTAPT